MDAAASEAFTGSYSVFEVHSHGTAAEEFIVVRFSSTEEFTGRYTAAGEQLLARRHPSKGGQSDHRGLFSMKDVIEPSRALDIATAHRAGTVRGWKVVARNQEAGPIYSVNFFDGPPVVLDAVSGRPIGS